MPEDGHFVNDEKARQYAPLFSTLQDCYVRIDNTMHILMLKRNGFSL